MTLTLLTPVPAPPAVFLGRERDVADVLALIGDRVLVTLWGAPGVGKTALACAAVRRLRSRAVAYVDVAQATSLAALIDLTALALRVELPPGSGQEAQAAVARSMSAHRAPLIVLDNAEAQIAAVRTFVSSSIALSAEVRFLVASRQRLAVREETERELLPLPVPTAEEDAQERGAEPVAALRLLVRHMPDGVPTSREDRAVLMQICRRLDGIPLGIEMAAAQLRVVKPAQLLERLERSHDLLVAGVNNPNTRQEAWATTMAWSWNLLDPIERRALSLLSVVAGAFTAERAAALLENDPSIPGGRVPELIGSLRDHSLLLSAGGDRFRMLQLVREHAGLQLAAPDLERARSRYAEVMARSAAGVDLILLLTKHRPDIGEDAAGLRAALATVEASAAATPAVHADLLLALSPSFLAIGPFATCCKKFESVTVLPDLDEKVRARLRLVLGLLRLRLGDAPLAAAAFDDALASRTLSAPLTAAAMLLRAESGAYLREADLLERTRTALEAAVASRRVEVEAYAHLSLAQRCLDASLLDEARRHVDLMNRTTATTWAAWQVWGKTILSFEETPALVRRDRIERALEQAQGRDRGFLLTGRAVYEALAGQLGRAEETLRLSMTCAAQAGDHKLEWSTLGHAGLVDLRGGDVDRAASRLGHVMSLGRLVPHEVSVFEQALRVARLLQGEATVPVVPVAEGLGPGRAAAARLYAAQGDLIGRLRRASAGEARAALVAADEAVVGILASLDCEPHRFEARLAVDTLRASVLRIPALASRELPDGIGQRLAAPFAIARDGSRLWRQGRAVRGQRLLHVLLGAMMSAYLEGDSTVSTETLYRAGWNEPLSPGPAMQRLRVAMSKLRKLDVPVEHDEAQSAYRLVFSEPPLVV